MERIGGRDGDPQLTDRGVKYPSASTPGPGPGVLNVLVACERSGRVRDAFRALGHNAVSCDLAPSGSPGPHLQCDVRDVERSGWDMLIAFPPCTYLTSAQSWRWYATARERNEAVRLVQYLWEWPAAHIAIENPQGWLNSHWRKMDQVIQPWWFGEPYTKRTCLWLKGLPPLMATLVHDGRLPWVNKRGGPAGRAVNRSQTFQGVANAMASQWGR